MCLGASFWKNAFAVGAVGVAAHRERPVLEMRHEHRRDVAVVAEQIALRDPLVRPERLVEVRELAARACRGAALGTLAAAARPPAPCRRAGRGTRDGADGRRASTRRSAPARRAAARPTARRPCARAAASAPRRTATCRAAAASAARAAARSRRRRSRCRRCRRSEARRPSCTASTSAPKVPARRPAPRV